jgi:hypothetical protein
MKFVMFTSALEDWMLASGWGNDCVGDQGILKEPLVSTTFSQFHWGTSMIAQVFAKN